MVHAFQAHSSHETNNPFFAPDGQGSPKFSGKTLVVPVVSAANVPQLAVDILIASLDLSRLGTFDSRYLVPVVGGREGCEYGVTTPLELFGKEDLDFVVVQQRSPVLKSYKDKFISSLLTFVQDSEFKALLFLSGVDLTDRTDSQMSTPIYHLLPSSSPPLADSPLALLTSLPRYSSASTPNDNIPTMPGGGLTRRVLTSIPEAWAIRTGVLVMFALEGDNRTDGTLMAGVIAKLLHADGRVKEWKEPESWRQGLFGTPNDQTLFG